jgi:hypothetical protein
MFLGVLPADDCMISIANARYRFFSAQTASCSLKILEL